MCLETSAALVFNFRWQVFGLYFMQSYIGVFYHALFHRNFVTLRQVLIQRLIVSEVGILVITFYMPTFSSPISLPLYYKFYPGSGESDGKFSTVPEVQLQKA